MELLDADWLSEGPIRLNQSLSLNDLSGSLVLNHARLVMEHMAANQGVKLTTTGNFNRKFVEQMVPLARVRARSGMAVQQGSQRAGLRPSELPPRPHRPGGLG